VDALVLGYPAYTPTEQQNFAVMIFSFDLNLKFTLLPNNRHVVYIGRLKSPLAPVYKNVVKVVLSQKGKSVSSTMFGHWTIQKRGFLM
jgi:hypothetical protein